MARHAPRVFRLARRMLGDGAEAEDVTQEAMLRLWRLAPDWQAGRGALATWLYRVTATSASTGCAGGGRPASTRCPRSPTRRRGR